MALLGFFFLMNRWWFWRTRKVTLRCGFRETPVVLSVACIYFVQSCSSPRSCKLFESQIYVFLWHDTSVQAHFSMLVYRTANASVTTLLCLLSQEGWWSHKKDLWAAWYVWCWLANTYPVSSLPRNCLFFLCLWAPLSTQGGLVAISRHGATRAISAFRIQLPHLVSESLFIASVICRLVTTYLVPTCR